MRTIFQYVLLIAVSMLSVGCSSTGTGNSGVNASAQYPDVFIGRMNSDALLAHYPAFKKSYDTYTPMLAETQSMESVPNDISIEVYMGTWCHDSEREVGRLLKLMDKSQKLNMNVSIFGLDYKKKDDAGRADRYRIVSTPTIIILRDGVEIGRIVESPQSSLGIDIARIAGQK